MEAMGGGAADSTTARAWLEVDTGALRRNAAALRTRLRPGTHLLPMVKADAYGLGAVRVARALAAEKPWGFGVATVEEGAALREAGVGGRVVAFTPCAPIDATRLLEWRLEPVVTSLGALREYAAAVGGAGRLRVHLEVDTGMGRFGLAAERAGEWAPEVHAALGGAELELASTFTHFHSAESDPEATLRQWRRFEDALSALRAAGVDPGLRHAANSAAVLRHPEVHADLVRPGLFLYGGEAVTTALGAGPGDGGPGAVDLRPEPVARVRARVLDVRQVAEGVTVSYGATFTTRRPSRLATLGIGYADGLPHALSNRGQALVAGRRVPFVGAVCMDMTVVDVTGVGGVRTGMAATLLGRDGAEEIELGELARLGERIPYELLTSFSARLPRVEAPPAPLDSSANGGEREPARGGGGGRPDHERIEEHGVEREQPA